ncbi:MAG TPA: nucleoside-diphosphate sugar epimerase [Ramlibacter sp.]|uniref:nucleoside-diphosphate sugar epimerase n=1 Tax=Ramlibacter sp. TaxID=1917967 RepID=UPI002ED1BEB7
MDPSPPAPRTALLAGATGLVGREILQGLLADEKVTVVHVLGRRPPALRHPKLLSQVVDFAALPALPAVDEAYLALGTTIKVAGSQSAFRAVDFDANLAVAVAAQVAGARKLGLVSAMGADARSRVFYSRTKGELEEALSGLGYEGLVIARPSLLVGDREALGQPERLGERIGEQVSRWLRPVIPANYRAIRAQDVAKALLRAVPTSRGKQVLLSGAMQ